MQKTKLVWHENQLALNNNQIEVDANQELPVRIVVNYIKDPLETTNVYPLLWCVYFDSSGGSFAFPMSQKKRKKR